VLTGPLDALNAMKAIIRQLDIRRAQVLVDAVVAEVSLDKAAELGIQWQFLTQSNERGFIGGTNFNPTTSTGPSPSILDVARTPSLIGRGLGIGFIDATTMVPGISGGILNLGALVKALASDASSNVLSTPTLVTMDNEEAEITVAQNVPFVTGQFTGLEAGATARTPFQTIQREDVGIILKVKPQISEGNTIRLQIEQEVSNLTPPVAGASDLVTEKRAIKTHVLIDSGDVLVLGGLIQDSLQKAEQKIPVLGDIPILGGLFRSTRGDKLKTNLMVFLHPVILRDDAMSARYTGSKYSYMRAEQLAERREAVALMPGEQAPLLPELKDLVELPPPFEEGANRAFPGGVDKRRGGVERTP
jgi:Type II secretory pathway, component PulD